MNHSQFEITTEAPQDHSRIETLLDRAFGADRRSKTAYRLREDSRPVEELSFTAQLDGRLVGAIQFWPLTIGERHSDTVEALLLGPLAVDPDLQGKGCGIALMEHGLAHARTLGYALVILVGDEPYYARVGFSRIPDGQIVMPGPVDPARLLGCEFQSGALERARGPVFPGVAATGERRGGVPRGTD